MMMEIFREGKGSEIKPKFVMLVDIQREHDRYIPPLPHKYHTEDHTQCRGPSDSLTLAVSQIKLAKQSGLVSGSI